MTLTGGKVELDKRGGASMLSYISSSIVSE